MSESEQGFSLVELLVVVGTIGILASTAIQHYGSMKDRSFDARAVSDLRNIISAQEAQFVDNEGYIADITGLTGFDASSPSVMVVLNATPTSWSGSSYHPQGTRTYCYNSSTGSSLVVLEGLNQPCP